MALLVRIYDLAKPHLYLDNCELFAGTFLHKVESNATVKSNIFIIGPWLQYSWNFWIFIAVFLLFFIPTPQTVAGNDHT